MNETNQVKKWARKGSFKTYAKAEAFKDSLEGAQKVKIHRQKDAYTVKAWYGEMQNAPEPKKKDSDKLGHGYGDGDGYVYGTGSTLVAEKA